jgi:AcrR family transcriptional regulator
MAEKKRKKTDLRVRYTQQILREHLLLLLNTKPIEKITVKELCESAGINRSTFYTHYTDLYDLMQQIKDRMKEYISHHIKAYINTDKTSRTDSLVEFLQYLKENKHLYLLLCRESGADSLREHTWKVTKDYYLNKDHRGAHNDFKEELSLVYDTYGHAAVIELWLRNSAPITEEELADTLINFTDQG